MARPRRNTTPQMVFDYLAACKQREGEQFSNLKKLELEIDRGDGLRITLPFGPLYSQFVIDVRDMRHMRRRDDPEGQYQFGQHMFSFVHESRNEITIFCDNPAAVSEIVLNHFQSEFKMKIRKLEIGPGNITESVVVLSQWLAVNQHPVQTLYISDHSDHIDPDVFKFILTTIRPTERLWSNVKVPPGFTHQFDSTCETLDFGNHGQWLTVENLLNKGGQRIVAGNTSFTNWHIIEYLNRWIPRRFEIGHEILDLELQDQVELSAIVSLVSHSKEDVEGRTFGNTGESRRIKFNDGRKVKLNVSYSNPKKIKVSLWPQPNQ